MRKWEQKCKDLCREIVIADPWCEKCGLARQLEQHHGLFKSSQRYKLNAFFWYDPTLQFRLCDECHKYDIDAPHCDQERFEETMRLRDPEKVKRLRDVSTGPLPPTIAARIIDWETVYGNLVIHGRPVGNEILENC